MWAPNTEELSARSDKGLSAVLGKQKNDPDLVSKVTADLFMSRAHHINDEQSAKVMPGIVLFFDKSVRKL